MLVKTFSLTHLSYFSWGVWSTTKNFTGNQECRQRENFRMEKWKEVQGRSWRCHLAIYDHEMVARNNSSSIRKKKGHESNDGKKKAS